MTKVGIELLGQLKTKGGSVSHSLSDKVTYWAVGWQLIKEYQKLKSIQTGPFYLNCQATGRASKNQLLTDA